MKVCSWYKVAIRFKGQRHPKSVNHPIPQQFQQMEVAVTSIVKQLGFFGLISLRSQTDLTSMFLRISSQAFYFRSFITRSPSQAINQSIIRGFQVIQQFILVFRFVVHVLYQYQQKIFLLRMVEQLIKGQQVINDVNTAKKCSQKHILILFRKYIIKYSKYISLTTVLTQNAPSYLHNNKFSVAHL
ncbi:Hypothetical_protein [Hexamita inflata]|uniref:Hypothetical_protein n=1 Tax=Hexamita inflata TaxID=28002 RepID=A0AA86P9Z0_9EUKA|nr:Hypothetical protein HINF_LOCUS22452 [Hexamita inflata]CAI9972411.1 Hypothetical protein HINF_LOCUS60056 [Hexamita inflata]